MTDMADKRSQGKKEYPRYLQFRHLRLSKKAREYQHEIGHITSDLISINQRLQRSLALCHFVIATLGKPKVGYRISAPKDLELFDGLLYHIENFSFRLFAYRDKLALFLTFTLDAPFEEGEMNLMRRLPLLKEARRFHIDTEIKRFYEEPIKSILEKRKMMTHRAYYKSGLYDPMFMPDLTPKEHGLRKATIAWRKKIAAEATKIDDCLVEVFTINTNLTKKLKKYLSSKAAKPIRPAQTAGPSVITEQIAATIG